MPIPLDFSNKASIFFIRRVKRHKACPDTIFLNTSRIFNSLAFVCLLGLKSLLFFLLAFNCHALEGVPEPIPLPKRAYKESASQIKSAFLSLEKKHGHKPANLWFLKYQQALLLQKKEPAIFCQLMEELSANPDFPLKALAKIKSYTACPFETEPLFEPDGSPKWLRGELAKAFYKRRRHFEHYENSLKATIYLAQNSEYKELRISYFKHAISLLKDRPEGLNTKHSLSSLKEQMYKESPSLRPLIKKEDFFLAAEDFKEKRQFNKAKKYYIKVLNSPDFSFKEKDLSFQALARIYKIQKNKKRLLKNTQQRSQWLLEQDTKLSLKAYLDNQLELARKQWNANKNALAIKSINQLLKKEHAGLIKEKALFLRGSIYFQENQKDLSLKDWDEAIKLAQKRKNRALLTKLFWQKAWLFRDQKNYKESYKNLMFLKQISKDKHNHHKALFWMAKTLEDLGQYFSAKKHYKELIRKDHFGYYGLLARKNLNKKWKIKKSSIDSIPLFGSKKDFLVIHWLDLLKEESLLSLFLKEKEQDFLKKQKVSKKDWLKMLAFWTKAGRYLDVFKALGTRDREMQKVFSKKYLALFFPLDFYTEVQRASEKLQIPKALIFAVIRQESAFNTRARSTADAFGLMQILPGTARPLAREYNRSFKNFKELYRADKNIFLGTAYLKKMLQKNQSLYLSIASYNAGPTAVKRWQAEFANKNPLEFVENITYEETRDYIRLVIRNYIIYHNLIRETEDWFPELLVKEQFF